VHEVLRVDAGVGHDLLQRPREDLLDLLERQPRWTDWAEVRRACMDIAAGMLEAKG
jgi:hypothetical protein